MGSARYLFVQERKGGKRGRKGGKEEEGKEEGRETETQIETKGTQALGVQNGWVHLCCRNRTELDGVGPSLW